MLLLQNGDIFATGMLTYAYRPATNLDTTPRIFLQVSFMGIPTTAFVDTGSPYVVCNPEIAEALGLEPQEGVSVNPLRLRHSLLDGSLHRIEVTLLAEIGQSLSVEATVFVPNLQAYQEWGEFPTVLGLTGFLERIRYAVDPGNDNFYFGEL